MDNVLEKKRKKSENLRFLADRNISRQLDVVYVHISSLPGVRPKASTLGIAIASRYHRYATHYASARKQRESSTTRDTRVIFARARGEAPHASRASVSQSHALGARCIVTLCSVPWGYARLFLSLVDRKYRARTLSQRYTKTLLHIYLSTSLTPYERKRRNRALVIIYTE